MAFYLPYPRLNFLGRTFAITRKGARFKDLVFILRVT